MVFQKWKYISVIWKQRFYSKVQPFLELTHDCLSKKIIWNIWIHFIFHMPPWWPLYLLWGLSNSSFCAGWFSIDFSSSSKQPNPKQKNNCCVPFQVCLIWFLLSFIIYWCLPHGSRHLYFIAVARIQYQELENKRKPRFFQSCYYNSYWWFFFMLSQHVAHG